MPKDYPYILSSSWYWPERAERIIQMASATDKHTTQTNMDMQLDTYSLFVPKLKEVILKGTLAGDIMKEIGSWKDEKKAAQARLALADAARLQWRYEGGFERSRPDGSILKLRNEKHLS